MAGKNGKRSENPSHDVSGLPVTGAIASVLRPIPVVGQIAGALQGLASSWLSSATDGLLNDSGFEIGNVAGTSDRLLEVAVGTTTLSSQEAVTVRQGYPSDPYPIPNDSKPPVDTPTLLGPAGERLHQITVFNWQDGYYSPAYAQASVRLPRDLMKDSADNPSNLFYPTAQRHHLHTSDFIVTVTVNANPFTGGCLLVVAFPNYPHIPGEPLGALRCANGKPGFFVRHQLTLFPHQFINLKTNNQATLILPYHGPTPVSPQHSRDTWTVVVYVWSRLYLTPYTSTNPVTVSVMAAATNVAFYGLAPRRDVVPEGDFRIAQNQNAIVSTHPLSDCVVLAQGAQCALDTSYLPGGVNSFAQPLSVPTLMLGTSKEWGGIYITPTTARGTMIYGFPVDPRNVVFSKTYLGMTSKLFTQWTGTINFHLMAVTTQMTRARLVICFTPGATTEPTTMEQAMAGTVSFFDIGLNSTFTFPIPFISETVWRTLSDDETFRDQNYSFYPLTSRMGVVTVWVYNVVQSTAPSTAGPIALLPFASAGADFSFRLPRSIEIGVKPYKRQVAVTNSITFSIKSTTDGSTPLPASNNPFSFPAPPFPELPICAQGARFENGPEEQSPVIRMGESDAASAGEQSAQAPVDAQPACYGNLEPGQPTQVQARDAWEGVDGVCTHTSPDMLFQNYFARKRLYAAYEIPRGADAYYLPIPISCFWSREENFPYPARFLQRLCMYMQADVRVDLQIQSYGVPDWYSQITVANIPPGADTRLGWSYNADNSAVLSRLFDFPFTTQPLSRENNTVSVMIPYQSPYNALCPWRSGCGVVGVNFTDTPVGIPPVSGRRWNYLPFNEFCTLGVVVSPSFHSCLNVFVSYHNVVLNMPLPYPQLGMWCDEPPEAVEESDSNGPYLWSVTQPFLRCNGRVSQDGAIWYDQNPSEYIPNMIEASTASRDLGGLATVRLSEECEDEAACFEAGELEWDYSPFPDHRWSMDTSVWISKRKWAGTPYTHWMITRGDEECSLEKDGFDAVVVMRSSEEPYERVHQVSPLVWSHCLILSRMKYVFRNYNILNNCTHFVECVSGVECENDGKKMLASLGLIGTLGCAIAVAAAFESPPREKTRAPRVFHTLTKCPDLAEQPSICDEPDGRVAIKAKAFGASVSGSYEWLPKHWTKATKNKCGYNWLKADLEKGPFENMSAASKQLEKTLKSIDGALTQENVEMLVASANAFGRASSSIDNLAATLTDMVKKVPDFVPTTQKKIAQKVASVLLKLVGLLVILFSSPTPLTLAGVVAILLGEAVDAASTDWATNLKNWIVRKLGLPASVMKYAGEMPKIFPDDAPDPTQSPTPTDGAPVIRMEKGDCCSSSSSAIETAKDFNTITTSMRNAEWIISKTKEFITWLLDTFTNWKQNSPEARAHQSRGEIFEIFADSVHSLDAQSVDLDQLEKNKKKAQSLMALCGEVKDVTSLQLLQRAYTNYCATERRVRQSQYSDRAEPVVVYFHGKPGCGKSLLSSILAKGLCKALGLDPKTQIYSQIPNSDFMDGYCGQAIHIIDDLGQDPEGKDWQNFCQMVSTVKFLPNMADLDQKGIPYKSKVIIATSNFPDPTFQSARDVAALKRRLAFPVGVATQNDRRLNAKDALAPIGPSPSPYFKATCHLLEGTAVTLTLTKDKQKQVNFFDLFNDVLQEVDARQRVHAVISDICFENSEWETSEVTPETLSAARYSATQSCVTLEPMRLPRNREELKAPWFTKLLNPTGNKTWDTVARIAMVLSIVASITTFGVMLYKCTGTAADAEGAYSGMKKAAVKQKPQRLSPPTVKFEGLPQIYAPVQKNCFPIQFFDAHPDDLQGFFTLTAVGTYDRTYITNYHGFEKAKWIQLRGVQYPVDQLRVRRVERNGSPTDVAVFTVPSGPCVKNILKFFRKGPEDPTPRAPAVLTVRGKMNLDVLASGVQAFDALQMQEGWYHGILRYRAVTAPGFCGAPLISYNPSHEVILGIHMASNGSGIAYGSAVYQSDIKPVAKEGLRSFIGKGLRAHVPTTTKLRPSPAWGAFPVTKEPAVLHYTDERLVDVDNLDGVLFSKYKQDMVKPFPGLEIGKQIVRNRLRKLIPTKLQQITVHDAINGIEGMDGIDMNQSPGVPYISEGVSRRSLFELVGEHWVMGPRLTEDYARVSNDPKLGHFATFLKDELRDTKKVAQGKTRLVEAGNLAHVLLGRKIFGNLFAVFNSNPGFDTMCAVGCDPDVHWTQFYHPLAAKTRVFDYDYSGFDGSVPSCAFDALADVLADLVEGEEEVRAYIDSLKSSFHHYKGKLWRLDGAMPSGCCGTSVFNSIINAMLLFSCFSQILPDFDSSEPLLIAYGDDVLVGTNQELPPSRVAAWVNSETTFQITPANKGSVFNDETDIHSVQFLKRFFTPDPHFPHLIHPTIDKATFEQSIMWQRCGDFQETLNSLALLAWHHGPKSYKAWADAIVRKCLDDGNPPPYIPPFPLLRHNWLMKFEIETFV
ncbi:polyprotein [Rosavirus C]|uniref:Genome polyprotein n=1 Tax=Rosavirus C TaxID=1902502 RepID=A0A1C9LUL5_9PICO|nr:polyprotein [Rosavirus C]AOQ26204.1 polyprotein [Rosavirus C]